MAATRGCLGEDEVLAFVGGRLGAAEIDAIEAHLDGCSACRQLIAGLAAHTMSGDDAGSMETVLQALVDTPEGGGAAPIAPASVIDGQYRIVRTLGRGGMGVVYLARDLRLDRDVAVKLGTHVSAAALHRVEREAIALARLSHPNVVVVHGVGETDGRLYIAMEFVAGGSAREWLAAKPRTWREIVALYAAAGDGLAAAHAAGLIHRDFKPDNVLVGGDGRPRVADFGLVRSGATSSVDNEPVPAASSSAVLDRMTQTGAVVGTPAYMPPEQIEGGDVDARGDQFAFCVALWEALFDARPFPGRTPAEIAAAIERDAPKRPERDQARRVPRHVIAALRRGLSRNRAQRWPSMTPLLAELRGDPGARRRRIAIAAAIAVTAGGAAVAMQRGRADDEPCTDGAARIAAVWSPARSARIAAAFEAVHASASWPAVRDRLDGFARAWALAHRDACRASRVDGSQSEAILDRRNLCLSRASAELDVIVAQLEGGDRAAIAKAPDAVGLLSDLAPCADVAKLSTEAPLPADPARRARIEAVGRYISRVEIHWGLSDTYQPRITGAIAVSAARASGWPPLMAEATVLRAEMFEESGEGALAETAYNEAAVEALADGDDDDASRAMTGFASWRLQQGDLDGAARWNELARSEWRRLGQPPSLAVHVLTTDGDIASRRGDYARVIADAREMLALVHAAWHDDTVHLAIYRGNLALALAQAGQAVEASREMGAALAGAETVLGKDHPRIALLCEQAAAVATMGGRSDDAVASARRAVAILEMWYGADDSRLVDALDKLGIALMFVDRGEARATLTRELVLQRRVSEGSVKIAETETNLAVLDAEDGRAAPALEHGQAALAILEKAYGADNPNLYAALILVGITSREVGKLDDSAGYLGRAVAILDRALGPDRSNAVNAHIELSTTLVAQGKAAEAIAVLAPVEKAIAGGADIPPPEAAEGHMALADARWAHGDRAAARVEAKAARAGYAAIGASFAAQRDQAAAWLRDHR